MRRGWACAAATAVAAATLLAGCGGTTVPSVATQCAKVTAVLSDGPDPAADGVGYALAQILPLRELSLPAGRLRTDVRTLSRAYATYYIDDGAQRARPAVDAAEAAVNAICPGAAP